MQPLIQYLKQQGYSPKTIKGSLRTIDLFTKWLEKQNTEPQNVQHTDLLAYVQSLKKREIKARTIERYMNAIRLYFDFLLQDQQIAANPVLSIKIQGVQRKKLYYTFSPEELNELYNSYNPDAIKKTSYPVTETEHRLIQRRNKVLLGVLIYQAVQTTELSRLQVSDIDLRQGCITIQPYSRSEQRTLQLESHQVLDIYDYVLHTRKEILAISKQDTELLFISTRGGNSISNQLQSLARQLRKSNKRFVNVQQIRASVIVKWCKQYNLREAQYRAGHRYVSSTEAYLVYQTQALQEEINQFHPLG